jgi:transcription elongation factor GreA
MPLSMPNTPSAKIPFTQDAYQKLQQDFDRLTTERSEVMKRLQTAREMGDLSENGAYIYAKFELGSIGRQLSSLKHLLTQGVVVQKNTNSNTISFGCTVTLQTGQKEVTFTLVSQHESNLAERKLSTESPLGQQILGKRVGEIVVVHAPSGMTTYTIMKIS